MSNFQTINAKYFKVMGYAVLHLMKPKGTSSSMSAHIERTVSPSNADAELTHLNRELIEFPDTVSSRTEAIQYRIGTAGLQRKIGKNQITAFNVLLSGSHDEMKHIQMSGKIDQWCSDNLDWLRKTYGEDNVVSAVLHLDESTPHIHATVVPIVTTERKKKKSEEQAKKRYRKKSPNAARLCLDEIMSRDKLKEYQDTYAQTMSKYGLQRGVRGSEARHVTTSQYYRDLMEQTSSLEQQKQQAEGELSKIKSKTHVAEAVKSIFSNSKIDTLRDELERLRREKEEQNRQAKKTESELKAELKKQESTIQKLKEKLDKMTELFPQIETLLSWDVFMQKMRLPSNIIKRLLNRETVRGSGDIYSPEHSKSFKVENAELKLQPIKDEPSRLQLLVDRTDIHHWFEHQNNEWIKKVTRIEPSKNNKPKVQL